MKEDIIVQSPTRVDFAGGTLDIPPLFLFHQPSYTINAAITVFTTAKIREASLEDPFSWKLISQDQHESVTLDESNKSSDFTGHMLELPIRFILAYGKGKGIMEISSDAPMGSGLGASSSLGVAVQSALEMLEGTGRKPMEFIEYVKSIETQSIKVPTGYQDFLAAYYKGVNIFSFTADGIRREPIKDDGFLKELEQHLFLVYTSPHFSRINNWELFKGHIDGEARIVNFFERLRENAERCREAFQSRNILDAAAIMTKDWEDRKAMIPSMSTPLVDEVIIRLGKAGALGWRVCGAGGGGCILFLLPSEKHEHAKEMLHDMEGVKVLVCSIAR